MSILAKSIRSSAILKTKLYVTQNYKFHTNILAEDSLLTDRLTDGLMNCTNTEFENHTNMFKAMLILAFK